MTPADYLTEREWTVPQFATGQAAVMITFDDEYESVYSEAFAYMQTCGVKGTFYVMTDAIGDENDPPYITAAELQEMDAAGWSIGNHTTDQTTLSDVDIPTATAKLAGAKTALDGLGLTGASMHCSYPNGGWDEDVTTAAIAAGMLTGRRVYTDPIVFPACDPDENYKIWSTFRLGSGDTLASALTAVNEAIAENKIVLFYGHKIQTPATDVTMWTPDNFRQLVFYCVYRNIPFLTINDFYALQSGPVTITRTPA